MPRPDVSEERKHAILEAASAVFARLGLHAARMEDIVAETGLSKGTLYWYFQSKDEIVRALLRRLFTGELKKLQALQVRDGSLSEGLLLFVQQYTQQLIRLSWLMPMTLDFYALATRKQWVRQFLQEYYQDFRKVLIDLIQQGITQGEFQTMQPEEAAIALIALIDGLTIAWLIDPQAIDLDVQGQAAAHLLLEGLKARA